MIKEKTCLGPFNIVYLNQVKAVHREGKILHRYGDEEGGGMMDTVSDGDVVGLLSRYKQPLVMF